MKKITCDFLIIGTGLAGLYSALKASKFGKVILISKSTLELSNTYWAQGGIAVVVDPNDSPEIHFEDTIIAGNGLNDPNAVEILVNEGRDRIRDLMNMGMEFDKSEGIIELGLEGGHSKRRILHAGGDATGLRLVEFLSKLIRTNENIRLLESTVIYELIEQDKTCFGAYAFNYLTKQFYLILAKGTILATGGASGVYKRSTNPYTTTGDGISLAYNIGAEIRDMEFIQFHPSAFYSKTGETFLISEAVRGEGAFLLNQEGERFMSKYHDKAELAPRDIVSLGIFRELQNSGIDYVFLDLSHLDSAKIKKRFSTIFHETEKYGYDLTRDLIPIAPAAHYTIGGIKTGYNAETNINRLFACGEASATGVHGANRLASNSLLECLVFGKRAVDSILNSNPVNTTDFCKEKKIKIILGYEKSLIELKTTLAEILNSLVGIIRNGTGLHQALSEINIFKNKFVNEEYENFNLKKDSLITVAELITRSALAREDSIGVHFREDTDELPVKKYYTSIRKNGEVKKCFWNCE